MRFLCVPVLLLSAGLARGDLLYCIGNSLTANAKPWAIGPDVGYHIDYGDSLGKIHAEPDGGGDLIAVRPDTWDVALATHDYDYLCVQPYWRTTLADVPAIEDWMSMQPDAVVILHSPWPNAPNKPPGTMARFEQAYHDYINEDDANLLAKLRADNPTREFRETHSVDALDSILHDIKDGAAPGSLLFTDVYGINSTGSSVHMSEIGEYLMHNLLSSVVGRRMDNWKQLGLNGGAVNPEVWGYLDSKVVEFFPNAIRPAPVPEPTSLVLLSILGGGIVAGRRLRRGRKCT